MSAVNLIPARWIWAGSSGQVLPARRHGEPGLGGAGGSLRRAGECRWETVPTLAGGTISIVLKLPVKQKDAGFESIDKNT